MSQHRNLPERHRGETGLVVYTEGSVKIPTWFFVGMIVLMVVFAIGGFFWGGSPAGQNTRERLGMPTAPHQPQPLYLLDRAAIYIPASELPAFEAGVREMARGFDIPPEWIMAVMYNESRFNPGIKNLKGSGATGLIQFMPTTAPEYGTTTAALGRMSATEQLQYVEAYLRRNLNRSGTDDSFDSLAEFYLSVLYPRAREYEGNPCYTLYSRGSTSYRQNSGLDEDKNGHVTWLDIDRRMLRLYPTAYTAGQEDILDETRAEHQSLAAN